MFKDVLDMLFKLLVWWLVAFGFFALLIMQCPKETEASVSITDVIYAIEEVESNRNPHAINTQENALGCLQIRPIMIADYNRITGEELAHDVAYNRSMAYIIASTIFNHYMKGIEKPNAKPLAFIWNGGGGAWRRVHYPISDSKQLRLEAYAQRAMTFL